MNEIEQIQVLMQNCKITDMHYLIKLAIITAKDRIDSEKEVIVKSQAILNAELDKLQNFQL